MDVTPPPTETANSDGDIGIIELEGARQTTSQEAPARTPRTRNGSNRGAPARRGAKRERPAAARRAGAPRARAPQGRLHRLVARSELGRSGVVAVDTPVGRLAVGLSNGRPFAVSDTCRHLFASLGEGRVLRDGCLQCPWHRSRYDVTTGKMVRGPQGLLFLTVRELVRAYTNLLFPLSTYTVVERGRVLFLDIPG